MEALPLEDQSVSMEIPVACKCSRGHMQVCSEDTQIIICLGNDKVYHIARHLWKVS